MRTGEPGPIIPLDKFAEEAAGRVRRRFERRGALGGWGNWGGFVFQRETAFEEFKRRFVGAAFR